MTVAYIGPECGSSRLQIVRELVNFQGILGCFGFDSPEVRLPGRKIPAVSACITATDANDKQT